MNRKISLKYGVLAGGLVVLYLLLFYLLDKELMVSMWVPWSSLLIYVFFMFKSIGQQRTDFGGKITFREAVSTAFLTFLVANVIFWVFHFTITKIDPSLAETIKQNRIELGKWLAPNADVSQLEKSLEGYDINLSTILLSFARGAIGGFMLSLPLAGFMRR